MPTPKNPRKGRRTSSAASGGDRKKKTSSGRRETSFNRGSGSARSQSSSGSFGRKPSRTKSSDARGEEKSARPARKISSDIKRVRPKGSSSTKRTSRETRPESEHGFFKKGLRKEKAPRPAKGYDTPETDTPATIRLNKFISNSGVCSRREADELIAMGLISVNGKVVTELGYKVKPGEVVRHEGKVLKAEKPVYVLLNKPKGYLTTTRDPQERNTVMELIGSAVKERIYPVGRLDRNTTGLLLLTNDGDLAEKLSHPSFNVKKIYKAELDKPLNQADFQKILEGVRLEEGRAMVDDLAVVSEDGKTVGLELHIGWNRVVRRIFETLGYNVVKLDRVVYAGLDKKDLPRGHWRFLKKGEIVKLKHFK